MAAKTTKSVISLNDKDRFLKLRDARTIAIIQHNIAII